MPFKRVCFIGDIPERQKEKVPLATVSMEVVGEVEPLAISDSSTGKPLGDNAGLAYEYSWNLGLTGRKGYDWLENLDKDDSVLVQLIFQTYYTPFTFRELFATLEYLPPTKTLKEQPNIVALSKKAILGIGEVGKSAGFGLLGSLSAAIADIIPSHDDQGSKWYLNKFHFSLDSGEPVYGIEWHISRRLIQEVGNRLVGRYGLMFLNSPVQSSPTHAIEDTVFLRGRFGLKHCADKYEGWYDFNMFPALESEALKLALKPKSSQ